MICRHFLHPMEWLNYHHLFYFWNAARLGGISAASKALRLTHPTISSQIKDLESSLGEPLFERQGRRLELTPLGRVVFRYADEIFSLGRELMDTVKSRPTGHPLRLRVGITEVVPKLVVYALLQPAFDLDEPLRLHCTEDHHERLLASLALHELDVVLSDVPTTASDGVRAFNHLLGESGVSFVVVPSLARKLRSTFPDSLNEQPFIMPTPNASLHRMLTQWFARHDLRPRIIAEIEDAALVKVFGESGMGIFAVPTVIEKAVKDHYKVRVVGRTQEVTERFYAITMKRQLVHPAVVAISTAARSILF